MFQQRELLEGGGVPEHRTRRGVCGSCPEVARRYTFKIRSSFQVNIQVSLQSSSYVHFQVQKSPGYICQFICNFQKEDTSYGSLLLPKRINLTHFSAVDLHGTVGHKSTEHLRKMCLLTKAYLVASISNILGGKNTHLAISKPTK